MAALAGVLGRSFAEVLQPATQAQGAAASLQCVCAIRQEWSVNSEGALGWPSLPFIESHDTRFMHLHPWRACLHLMLLPSPAPAQNEGPFRDSSLVIHPKIPGMHPVCPEDHYMWAYARFLLYLDETDPAELNGPESYVKQRRPVGTIRHA